MTTNLLVKSLYEASNGGDASTVATILEDKDFEHLNEYYHNMTVLYTAAGEGNVKVVSLLLDDERIEVNKGSAWGRTPF